ncbi:hypothetical protein HYX12_04755, partial [Candidatus Woesearchaeota archaeon]|nr:hypothetical protein [Candidatus Woesearchaeota archaeon]
IDRAYLGNDAKAKWGDQLEVKVNIYKGNTNMTSIELWAEKDGKVVSKRGKFNIYENFRPYTLTLPLQLRPNCAHEDAEDGAVKLILEGLGNRAETSITIEGINKDICKDYSRYIEKEEKQDNQKLSFDVIELPAEIEPGSVLPVKVHIANDNNEHDYSLYAYVYRGRRCYSCQESTKEKESNVQKVSLQEEETKIVDFSLKIDSNVEEGEYKLKVKIRKDQQKTEKEITKSLFIKEGTLKTTNNMKDAITLSSENSPRMTEEIISKRTLFSSGVVVYESNPERIKEIIPYFLLAGIALVVVLIAFKDH